MSGTSLTTPSSNVFLGENSGQYATTASSNICIGTYAGSYASIGTSRLSTGTNNIIIGGYAGDKITTETNNICIGHQADNYDTGISNRITLGNSSITSLRIPGIQSGATNGQVLTYNSGSGGSLELADSTGLPLSGGAMTGPITTNSTFDGRDVGADGTKLDGIEASADVTDAGNVNPLVDSHLNKSTASSGEVLSWSGSDYDWVEAGGASGGVFYENSTTVSSNYTITSNKNAVSAGPIIIASGVTVTVPSGSRWAVV